MKLIYVAHPFGGIPENADNAELWCSFLNRHIEGAIFIAPWIPMVRHWLDSGETRARGLMLDIEAVKLCSGLLAICHDFTAGMQLEWAAKPGMMERLRLPFIGTALPVGENIQGCIKLVQPFADFLNTGVIE